MKKRLVIILIFLFIISISKSNLVYAEDSLDKETRIAIAVGSVFGAWLGWKLFHKKETKSSESLKKSEKQNLPVKNKDIQNTKNK